MLSSDFSRKAHANFQNYYFLYATCFSSTLTSNLRQFHEKIEVYIVSNYHFTVSIDVFNHFNSTNIKIRLV